MPKRRTHDLGAVDRLFAGQGGLATRAQLIELGVAPSTIRYRERRGGPWRQVLKGVCANHTRPLTTADRIRAALLFAGPGAVVTGIAALLAYQVRAARAADPYHRVRVLIPHTRRRSAEGFVVVTRTSRPTVPVYAAGGAQVALAPIPRAAVDACLDTQDMGQIREIVGELLRTHRCTAQELARELTATQTRHSARMRAVLAEYLPGARFRAEAGCRQRLLRSAAPPPLWNSRILDQATGRSAVVPGALWLERGLALEVEGPGDCLEPGRWEQTLARRRWMTAVLRLTVAHVTPNQLRDSWEEVWADLRRLLDRPPTYRLPPGFRLA